MQISVESQEPTNYFDLLSMFGCFSFNSRGLPHLSSNGSSSILPKSLYFDGFGALGISRSVYINSAQRALSVFNRFVRTVSRFRLGSPLLGLGLGRMDRGKMEKCCFGG